MLIRRVVLLLVCSCWGWGADQSVPADSPQGGKKAELAQEERLAAAEKDVLATADILANAKRRKMGAFQANQDLHARNQDKTFTDLQEKEQMAAKYAKAEREIDEAKAAVAAAQKKFEAAMAAYRALGGAKDFGNLMEKKK